jgi:tRNA 2-(methylsulfanyl)-N6-isopentenyladenosine37 hydroxylase
MQIRKKEKIEVLDISHIRAFLHCETPQAWLDHALNNLPTLLIDHANCEKKAAATAMNLMYRYVDKVELLQKMSQLAREELLHFEQVVNLMSAKGIEYHHLSASRYASSLRQFMASHEPDRLVDTLIVGAFVEARSCERFAKIAPDLEPQIQKFYVSLLKSESRHFEDYLYLAQLYSKQDIAQRVAFFADKEAELISSVDTEFRFHSGKPEMH